MDRRTFLKTSAAIATPSVLAGCQETPEYSKYKLVDLELRDLSDEIVGYAAVKHLGETEPTELTIRLAIFDGDILATKWQTDAHLISPGETRMYKYAWSVEHTDIESASEVGSERPDNVRAKIVNPTRTRKSAVMTESDIGTRFHA